MRTSAIALALCLTGAVLKADFTYQKTSQMTGGQMYNMLRNVPMARRATDPTISTVIVKGNRMATINKDTALIVDLDKESVTNIDFGKKQYSVITFAQMKKAMDDALARSQAKNTNTKSDAEPKFKVTAKATGQTKTINGLNAKEMIVSLQSEITDTKSSQSGAMNILTDSWMANVPGYEEVKNFQVRMGEKMGYLFDSGMSGMGAQAQPGMLQGFAEVSKEMAKVEGVPVLQITKMGNAGMDANASSSSQQQQPQAQQQSNPGAGAAAAGAIGKLGGFGGFGRGGKKKEDQPQEQSSGQAPAGGSADSGVLIETTTELSTFSTAAADASKFDVPAGFKQVENPMARGK